MRQVANNSSKVQKKRGASGTERSMERPEFCSYYGQLSLHFCKLHSIISEDN